MIIPKMEERGHTWFALADAESCRLLCVGTTEQGTQHVDEHEGLKNALPEQEHARPTALGGATHNIENNERRFAAEIIHWLQTKSVQHKVEHLVILAPPRMLGVLRTVPLGSLKGRVEELKGDLMRLNTGQLANHAMIRELLPPHPSDGEAAFKPKSTSMTGERCGGGRDEADGGGDAA